MFQSVYSKFLVMVLLFCFSFLLLLLVVNCILLFYVGCCVILSLKCVEVYKVSEYEWNGPVQDEGGGGGFLFNTCLLQPLRS